MRTSILRPLLAGALAAGAPLAFAAETLGVLAVADPPGPTTELVELTAQLRAVLAEKTPGVLDASQLRDRMAGNTSTATLSELDRAFVGALAAYQGGDYEGSIRTLRAVIEDLEKLPDGPDTFSQWTRAMLRLARAEQTIGRRAEATAVLERLVRANPQVKVDLTQYPPSFAKQVDEVRARLKSLATRKLTVTSPQKGVHVFVDGREVGTAPVTIHLAAGRYKVSGRAADLRVPSVQTDLSEADQTVSLDFGLADALRPAAGPGLALARVDRARRVVTAAAWLGLDRTIIATFTPEGDVNYLQASLIDVRRGMIQREGRLRLAGSAPPPGGLSALATFLMTGQSSALVAAAPTPAPVPLPPPPAAAGKKVDLRPSPASPAAPPSGAVAAPGGSPALRWSPVATAVVAVGLGVYAGLQLKSASDSYSKANDLLVNGQVKTGQADNFNKYSSDGDSARQRALYTGIGAGVAVGLTGVLSYLSYRQSGEVGPFRF